MTTPPLLPIHVALIMRSKENGRKFEASRMTLDSVRCELYHYAKTGECNDPHHLVRRYIAAVTSNHDASRLFFDALEKIENHWAARARRIGNQLEAEAGQDDAVPKNPTQTTTDEKKV